MTRKVALVCLLNASTDWLTRRFTHQPATHGRVRTRALPGEPHVALEAAGYVARMPRSHLPKRMVLLGCGRRVLELHSNSLEPIKSPARVGAIQFFNSCSGWLVWPCMPGWEVASELARFYSVALGSFAGGTGQEPASRSLQASHRPERDRPAGRCAHAG